MIKRLFKIHISFVKYFIIEMKRKKNNLERKEFIKTAFKNYSIVMKNEFKQMKAMLTPSYYKQKKEFLKKQQFKKDLQNAYRILQYMVAKQGTRTERKNIRRDFEKYGIISVELEKEIFNELYKKG
jgi:ribosomal protein S4